ncbi:unnamed protein product [Gongylonema pulchrum]|uniref:Tr-type G domain-containing protein n=1 Tax=Gongylonema pulchrum TaxID=637853 RepID=A0A183DXP9_9BILA|nr:unnamed protein product [Gongylonema pulchrum]
MVKLQESAETAPAKEGYIGLRHAGLDQVVDQMQNGAAELLDKMDISQYKVCQNVRVIAVDNVTDIGSSELRALVRYEDNTEQLVPTRILTLFAPAVMQNGATELLDKMDISQYKVCQNVRVIAVDNVTDIGSSELRALVRYEDNTEQLVPTRILTLFAPALWGCNPALFGGVLMSCNEIVEKVATETFLTKNWARFTGNACHSGFGGVFTLQIC